MIDALVKSTDVKSQPSNFTSVKWLSAKLEEVKSTFINSAPSIFAPLKSVSLKSTLPFAFLISVLNGTDFSYSKADYCNFSDADMAGAIFQGADLTNSDFSAAENLNACRFDEETIWPDNEYLPEDFDSNYASDLSSLQDEDDYQQSDY